MKSKRTQKRKNPWRRAVRPFTAGDWLRLFALSAVIRKYFAEHPDHFDPRQYLTDARTAIKEIVRHKIVHVLGCSGKA